MVSDKDGRANGVEVVSTGDDLKANVGRIKHTVMEGSGCSVLGAAVIANNAEVYGGKDAIEGAESEGAVGGCGACNEGRQWC